jgi:hypothetical protein
MVIVIHFLQIYAKPPMNMYLKYLRIGIVCFILDFHRERPREFVTPVPEEAVAGALHFGSKSISPGRRLHHPE